MNEQSPNENRTRVNPAPFRDGEATSSSTENPTNLNPASLRDRAREIASRPKKESAVRTAKFGLRLIERGVKGFARNFDPRGREKFFYAAGIGTGVVESVVANSVLGPVLGPVARAGINFALVQGVEVGFNVYRKRFIERELSKVPGIENATEQDVAAKVKEIEQKHKRASKKLKDFMAGLAVGNTIGSLGILAFDAYPNISESTGFKVPWDTGDAQTSPTPVGSVTPEALTNPLPPPDIDKVALLTEPQKEIFNKMIENNLVTGAARDAMGGYGDYLTLQGTGDQMGGIGEKYVNSTMQHFNLPESARTSVEALVKKQIEAQANNIYADLATRTTDVNLEVAKEGAQRLAQALETPEFQQQIIGGSHEKLAELIKEINNPAVMQDADVVHLAGISDSAVDKFINNVITTQVELPADTGDSLSKLDYNQLRGVVFDNLADDLRPQFVDLASQNQLSIESLSRLSNTPIPVGTASEVAARAAELIAENQRLTENLSAAALNLPTPDSNIIERLAQNFGVEINTPEWFDALEDYLERNSASLVGAFVGGFGLVSLAKFVNKADLSRIINRARNGDPNARRTLNSLVSNIRRR